MEQTSDTIDWIHGIALAILDTLEPRGVRRAGASYLLVLANGEAVGWVLKESRMAFPATRRAEVDRLTVGDELFLLTTRDCWDRPHTDRTRIIGLAEVTSPVEPLQRPLKIASREFTRGCGLKIHSLTPFGTGVDLKPLLSGLDAFPDDNWSIRLRRPLVELSEGDAELIRQELAAVAGHPRHHIQPYLRWTSN